MKRTFLVVLLSLAMFSCKNSSESKTEDEPTATVVEAEEQTFQGEFIYTPEAAVFKGNSFIYGVAMNDRAKDLAQRVDAVKKEDYDMVPVVVRGTVVPKPEGSEGWDQILTITKIITVSDTPTKADIQLIENKK